MNHLQAIGRPHIAAQSGESGFADRHVVQVPPRPVKRANGENKHLPGQQQKYAHQTQGHHHFHKIKPAARAANFL
jgi:hypothetical protein